MPIELKFSFTSIDNAKAFMSGLGKKSKDALEGEPEASAPTAEPINLGPGVVEQALAAATPVAGTAATETPGSDISSMLGGAAALAPTVPVVPPAAAPVLPAAAPAVPPVAPAMQMPAQPPVVEPQQAPAVPAEAPPSGIDAAAVIKALSAVGQMKGRDALVGVLSHFGAATATDIKPEQYVPLLNHVNQVLNS